MKKKVLSAAIAFALTVSSSVFAQSNSTNSQKTAQTTNEFFPLSEIKPGMRAKSKTVFAGTQPEEFEVEILGVLPGFIGPKQPAIIGRLHGANAERTGVFAGMSGSPVFIDGKLIGAISFSFPFSKEPIAGITPIQNMIDIMRQSPAQRRAEVEPKTFSFTELASADYKPNFSNSTVSPQPFLANVANNSPLVGLLGQQFAPIATPLVFSGIRQETLNQYAAQLASVGLLPVAAAGGSSEMTGLKKYDDKTLQPGDSVSVALARGDYSLAAAGTVTYRSGDQVYAFGHQFMNLGLTNMPMSESSVITVIPNQNNSFKLAVPQAMVGALAQDRSTGILGKLGEAARMIPVQINVRTSRNQSETYNFEVVNDSFLTALLLNVTVFNSITATEREVGDSTIAVRGQVDVKDAPPIKIERRFSTASAPIYAAGSVAAPVSAFLNSRFDNAEIKNVRVDIVSTDDKKTAALERLAISKAEVKAGESFETTAFVRADGGKTFVQRVPVQIPADTPAGTYLVYVGDGASFQQVNPARAFTPKNVVELVDTINKTKKNDRLYLQVTRVTNGAIIGANEMPNLPPSMLAALNNDRAVGGITPTILSPIIEQELQPAEFVISGQQVLSIEVTR